MESEKVSININNNKLAAIDLLIDEGLVSNRSSFINEAIDLLIEKNSQTIDNILKSRNETLSDKFWFLGIMSLDKEHLLKYKKHCVKLTLNGFGSLYLKKDIDVELLNDTIESITKKIKVHGTNEQLEALKDKRTK